MASTASRNLYDLYLNIVVVDARDNSRMFYFLAHFVMWTLQLGTKVHIIWYYINFRTYKNTLKRNEKKDFQYKYSRGQKKIERLGGQDKF